MSLSQKICGLKSWKNLATKTSSTGLSFTPKTMTVSCVRNSSGAFIAAVYKYIKPVSHLIAVGIISDVEHANIGAHAKLEAEGFFRSIARLVELCARGEECGFHPIVGHENSFIFAALLRKQSAGLNHGAIRAVEYLLFGE